uniref:C2H2-type domain-containing protein n=1 Tax=Globodera pallida TaxID=36090 RepID=A0A183C730_GLOPA
MVFFICDECGETMKKKQVLQHNHRCHTTRYSCMDCQTVFDRDSYQTHVKCITEDQKYGGVNHVPKVNKGELKQDAWVVQVRAAIRRVTDPRLKILLREVQKRDNIPRKEGKFINFLQNSLRIRNRALCVEAWQAIKTDAEKRTTTTTTTTTAADAPLRDDKDVPTEDNTEQRTNTETADKEQQIPEKREGGHIKFDEDE